MTWSMPRRLRVGDKYSLPPDDCPLDGNPPSTDPKIYEVRAVSELSATVKQISGGRPKTVVTRLDKRDGGGTVTKTFYSYPTLIVSPYSQVTLIEAGPKTPRASGSENPTPTFSGLTKNPKPEKIRKSNEAPATATPADENAVAQEDEMAQPKGKKVEVRCAVGNHKFTYVKPLGPGRNRKYCPEHQQ